jgi:hypothetical protein
MATAAHASTASESSPLIPPLGLTATPVASGREAGRCPEWHSLRLFGSGRHPAGFEMGSEPRLAVL